MYTILKEGSTKSKHPHGNYEHLTKYILEITKYPNELPKDIKKVLSYFISQFNTKWSASSRNVDYFLKKNFDWLETKISFPMYKASSFSSNDIKVKGGRPKVDFSKSSERTKRRKTQLLRSEVGSLELSYAAQMSLRASGQLDAANVIKDVTLTTPKRAEKYRKAYKETSKSVMPYTDDKALSLIIEAKLSKHQYNILRSTAKLNNCNIYPPYEKITLAKKRCYPESMTITEICAEVRLQALLEHTCIRIIQTQSDVINHFSDEQLKNLKLICKWGCDGSNQKEYKQMFEDNNSSDDNVFLISLVPLQLIYCENNENPPIYVWTNPRPSSPRFCRPIKIKFIHETTKVITIETKNIENQIESLIPSSFIFNDREVVVNYQLLFTMVDGKVCNAVCDNKSTLKCYICGATSKDFNDISNITRIKIDESNIKLNFGLSILHAWIRFFECLLHLAFKLNVKKWRVLDSKIKEVIKTNNITSRIQQEFKSQLGLIVDKPKPGFGSSNDGNTARRFFENSFISSSITGIDEGIIKQFQVVLLVISSGYNINVDKFKIFTLDTAKNFVNKYPWYPMSTTVH